MVRSEANVGAPYKIPINPSNVVITKLKEKKDRMSKIEIIKKGIDAKKTKNERKIRATEKALG